MVLIKLCRDGIWRKRLAVPLADRQSDSVKTILCLNMGNNTGSLTRIKQHGDIRTSMLIDAKTVWNRLHGKMTRPAGGNCLVWWKSRNCTMNNTAWSATASAPTAFLTAASDLTVVLSMTFLFIVVSYFCTMLVGRLYQTAIPYSGLSDVYPSDYCTESLTNKQVGTYDVDRSMWTSGHILIALRPMLFDPVVQWPH